MRNCRAFNTTMISTRIALGCFSAAAAASGVPGVPLSPLIRTLSLYAIGRALNILHPNQTVGWEPYHLRISQGRLHESELAEVISLSSLCNPSISRTSQRCLCFQKLVCHLLRITVYNVDKSERLSLGLSDRFSQHVVSPKFPRRAVFSFL